MINPAGCVSSRSFQKTGVKRGSNMRWIFCFLCISPLFSATVIKGRLEDGTQGGPGKADRVALVGLGQGMQTLVTLENVEGDFELNYDGTLAGTSWLVQATKGTVIYSVQGASLTDPVVVRVFDADPNAEITPRGGTIALSAIAESFDIGRFINLDNQTQPPVTLERPEGTFSFELEDGFRKVEASTTRGKMPLRQNLVVEGTTATLNYPLRPGRTQLMVRTEHPYDSAAENTYRVPLLPSQTFAHILVLPLTLDISGEGIQFVSEDNAQGVKLYEWEKPVGQTHLEFTVVGQSADQVPEVPPGTSQTQAQATQQQGPQIGNHPHPLDRYRWFIVAGVGATLLLFSLMGLLRRG